MWGTSRRSSSLCQEALPSSRLQLYVGDSGIPGLDGEGCVRTYRPHQILMASDAAGMHVGIIHGGICKEILVHHSGRQHLVSFLRNGALFGEVTMLTGRKFSFELEVVAITDTTARMIPMRRFEDLFTANPDFCRWVCRAIAAKERSVITMLNLSAFYQTTALVIDFLLACEAEGLHLAMSHAELADMIGRSRVSVTNALLQLQKEGVIEQTRKHIAIVDPIKLRGIYRAVVDEV